MPPDPRNSPQAAARIMALAMVADGQVCKAELDVLVAAVEHWGLHREMLRQDHANRGAERV